MSIASTNLFSVLGDDEPAKVSAPVDKKTTSSKKSEVAPKADPTKAKKKAQPTGNEAVFKDKNAGHSANKNTPAPENTGRRSQRPARMDRHSGTGKTDTKKQLKKGWGDDNRELEEEQAGEKLAKQDENDTEAPAAMEEEDTTQTLEQYMANLKMQQSALEGDRSVRKANDGDDSKWKNAAEVAKVEEEFFTSGKQKSLRQKQKKEKNVIEPELTFAAPERDRGRPTQRGGRGGQRGGARGRGGGAPRGRGGQQQQQQRQQRPRVDVTNTNEFPTLGA